MRPPLPSAGGQPFTVATREACRSWVDGRYPQGDISEEGFDPEALEAIIDREYGFGAYRNMTFRQGWAVRQLLAEEKFAPLRGRIQAEDNAFAATVARLKAEKEGRGT